MSRLGWSRVGLFAGIVVTFLVAQARPETQTAGAQVFYKGNLHTHTLNSDGDSTPDDVVRWYREHNYNFVTLTDHNYLTSVDGLNALHGADDKFLVMRGEELCEEYGRDLKVSGKHPVAPGQVDRVSPRIGDVHVVANEGKEVAVSIHVYGGNIGAVRRANSM